MEKKPTKFKIPPLAPPPPKKRRKAKDKDLSLDKYVI